MLCIFNVFQATCACRLDKQHRHFYQNIHIIKYLISNIPPHSRMTIGCLGTRIRLC